MLSFAAGSRFLQLLGGVNLSFYDWYCDLPNASPEVWGEQTDVAESADWYNSKYIAVMGSNLGMTRTPDVHFLAQARHNGTKLVVLSPDYSMTSKFGDWWIPVHAGQDGAFWMAVNHVILNEFHHRGKNPYFLDYLARYTDCPFLVELEERDGALAPGRLLRRRSWSATREAENGEFKFLVWDAATDAPRMPLGTLGFRWQQKKGEWNLQMKDGLDGGEIEPRLSFLEGHEEICEVSFPDFAEDRALAAGCRRAACRRPAGTLRVATVYDLLMAQFGVERGLGGEYPAGYDDAATPYTPAWQEKFTGVDRANVIQFAREWAGTAEQTEGKCCIIIGAGVNHWYHANLTYRAGIAALMLCGCVGRNGGGLNHYVGQEKLAPVAPWTALFAAMDWMQPPRLQNSPSFHYVHSDQWRYESAAEEARVNRVAEKNPLTAGHTMDHQVRAVRLRLAAVLSPVRPQLPGAGAPGARRRGAERGGDGRLGGPAAQGEEAALRRRGPGRAGELAAGLVHLARQRPLLQRQGARVFPQALPGHPPQQHRPGDGEGFGQGGGLARAGAGREARPGGRPQLPHGHLRPLLRHRPAGGHLVREGRPEHHRPALLHPPAAGRRPPLLGIAQRLGHLQGAGAAR